MGSHAAMPDIGAILSQLTLEEKVSLLAGKNFWETVDIPEKGIPSVKVQYTILTLKYCTD
jgi:beta-glucosidase